MQFIIKVHKDTASSISLLFKANEVKKINPVKEYKSPLTGFVSRLNC
jgi:hypothetical protein